MKLFGKPIAVSLTAVLLAANLSMPFTSLTAFGSDTDSAIESTENTSAEEAVNEEDRDIEAENSLDGDINPDSAADEEITESAESGESAGSAESAVTEEEETAADEVSADDSAGETVFSETGEEETASEEPSADISAAEEASVDAAEDLTVPAQTEQTAADAVDAAQEMPEDDPELQTEPLTESIIPIDEICEDTENDDVFAAYVNRELELTGDLQCDTGDLSDTSNNSEKAYASTRLTGYNRTLYAVLYNEIGQVARGERTDTVFTVSLEDFGLKDKYWSASDLGVSDIVDDYGITDEAIDALNEKTNISFTAVLRALLLDCPYDLYWYDKTESTRSSLFGYGVKRKNGEYVIYYSDYYNGEYYDAEFSFPVAAEYSASGELNTYETNAEIGSSVTTAYNTAHSIVDQYSGSSDYEKMDGYRAEICKLASYNDEAAENSNTTNYGNPWQLIWVFDKDPATTVVCEGYSKGFQYLCDLSEWNEIFRECISVVGEMDGGGHMWNIVALRDGRSYLVDVTNCDTGTIGAGSDGHDLFLVGTGDPNADEVYCQGNIEDGYTFAQLYDLHYTYRDTQYYRTRDYFDDDILTLAEGRVYAETTAPGEYTGDHTHIYYNVDEVAATCQSDGHSAGGQCSICGEYEDSVVVYPKTGHKAGEWTLTSEPTYDAEGTETATCTVCGTEMTRPVDKLVSETGITLDYQELTLDGNESKQLTATVLPENAHDKSVFWKSSNTSVAAVDQSGRVTARNNGTTIITAQSAHLGLTASCKVTVQVHVQSIHVNPQGTQVAVGGTTQLYVDISPSNAYNKKYTWSSSDKSIATISSSGLVTGIASGEAIITATAQDGGLTSSCRVNVFLPVTGVTLQPSSLTMNLNDRLTLTPTIIPEGATNQSVTWTSSNRDIVFVGVDDGSVHARSVGTAKVTVTTSDGGYTASCTITVVIPVESIELDHSDLYLEPGESETLNATVLPDSATNKTVTWSSSDEDVASVGSDGSVTAIADGTATITATAVDGGLTASCTVNVKSPAAEPTDLAGAVADGTAQVSIEDGLVYNGTAQVPEVTITYQGKPLTAGADFSVSCSNNTNAGTATAVINGKGEYTGSFTRNFTIAQAPIQGPWVSGLTTRPYTGVAWEPKPVVKNDSTTLKEGTDYTLSYANNINAGMATVTVTGKGNYTGNPSRTFVITPAVISNTTFSGLEQYIYTGAELTPSLTITFNGRILTAGTDYTLGYSSNVDAGRGRILLTGKGNFTGTKTIIFTIKPAPIDEASVNSIEDQIYTGSALQPAVTVTLNGKTLTADTDYTVEYANNTEPGTADLTITGTGNYTGEIKKTFRIVPVSVVKSIENAEISGLTDRTYNEQDQTQTPVVKLNGTALEEGTDYTVSYENNRSAGTATVTITGIGQYEGTVSATFKIAKADQSFTVKAAASSIDAGKTTKVTASGAKETTKYTFKSSNTSTATVNASGTVTGKAAGTVTITVSTAETANYKAGAKTVKITVNKVLKKPGYCHFVKWNNSKYTGCRIGWNKTEGADGYETLLSWTDGSHASRTIVKSNVLYRDCTVVANHVSQMMVRAFYMSNGQRKFGPWSNVEYITPSPTKLTTKNASSGSNLKMNISWNIIYGCNGYNVFITTNPNGTWYWNQSTSINATATSAVVTKYRGSALKKNTRYYVRIVTRRQRNGVFCTVPMPAANTNIGSFIIK